MQITNLRDMYIAELQEIMSLEAILASAVPLLAEVASHRALKDMLLQQEDQVQMQKRRLNSILRVHGADPTAHTDQAMQALVKETRKMLTMVEGADLRDAALIASVQKIQHYQIAAYGTAASLADHLDYRDDRKLLHDSLEEERRVDAALTKLAKEEVNHHALAA